MEIMRPCLASFFLHFCPNISAHASLVTTDAFSALFTILPLYYLWKFCRFLRPVHFFWFVLWLSVAQLAKQSLTWLYPIVFLTGLLFAIYFRSWRKFTLKRVIAYGGVFILTTLLIFNIGFQFKETGKPLGTYAFKSRFFSGVQAAFEPIAKIPLPVPSPYLYGLDYTKNMDEMGGGRAESSGNIYLLGESRKGQGFYSYYFVIALFKTPIPLLLGICLSIFLLFRIRFAGFAANEFFLLFPVAFFLVYFDFFYRSQVGLRHVLMIYPPLIVFAGKGLGFMKQNGRKKIIAAILMCWSVASFYFYFPLLMAYTNEFIPDKKKAYKIMADSNLDYDNAVYYLNNYLRSHADVHYAPTDPATGKFVIRTTDLLDLNNIGQYQWLRANFEPVGHVAFTYLVFDISTDQLKQYHLIK